MSQVQMKRPKRDRPEVDFEDRDKKKASKSQLARQIEREMDEIMEEIDSVLDENAEELQDIAANFRQAVGQ